MKASQVTADWLSKLNLIIVPTEKCPTIQGVVLRDLTVRLDGRGEVTELWSRPWVEKFSLSEVNHVYQSATDYGVVKCWHLHDVHIDQFTVTRGKLQVTMVDLREESPSFAQVNTVFLGSLRPRILKIPPMILHGWKALSEPEVIVVNLQSHTYTPDDEFKFPWDCIIPNIWQPQNG